MEPCPKLLVLSKTDQGRSKMALVLYIDINKHAEVLIRKSRVLYRDTGRGVEEKTLSGFIKSKPLWSGAV